MRKITIKILIQEGVEFHNLNKILKKNLKMTRHSNKRVQSRTELYSGLISLKVFRRYPS